MLAGEATADQDVKTDKVAVFFDGDEAEVVGVDIDFVVRRDDHGGFEFARQVGLPRMGSTSSATSLMSGFGGSLEKTFSPSSQISA